MTVKLTIAELFAGVGGFRKGFEDSSTEWETVWANQWEPSASDKNQFAFNCYQANFGIRPEHSNEDISTVNKKNIPNHTVLVGGFPCQDYSVARTGASGIEGKKGVLWWQIEEIIEKKQPKFILLENVDRLLKSPTTQRGRDFAIMLYGLNKLGYGVEWRVINAADYGHVQRRRRVFIFAYKTDTEYFKTIDENNLQLEVIRDGFFTKEFKVEQKLKIKNRYMDINLNDYKDLVDVSDNHAQLFYNSGIMHNGQVYSAETTPAYGGKEKKLGSILEKKEVPEKYFLTEHQKAKFAELKGAKKIERKTEDGHIYFYSEGGMSEVDASDKPARTMLTSEGTPNRSSHVVLDKKTGERRFILPLEAEQINGFPKNWTRYGKNTEGEKYELTDRQRYFTMGNALVVPLITTMAGILEEIIENENEK